MKYCFLYALVFCWSGLLAQVDSARNPIIHADVPDMSIIRNGDAYYMSSTTMHMSPGVPIMKSTDLVNWELIGYAYDTLAANNDALNLENGLNAYGRGSWASSLRFVDGTYYVSTFSSTTNKTYVFSTTDIESGNWKKHAFSPSYHDNTLFFNDGKIYLIWGAGRLHMIELKDDFSGVKEGTERVLIENASAPIKSEIMLQAEGSQLFKVKGKYYLFNIAWPRGGMRTVIVQRADKITGPYEGKIVFQDKGVAQGGLIDTPDGEWFAYLFRDYGAVGRIPYLVPVNWKDGWPVLGIDGKVPDQLDLPANQPLIPGIVNSDEFNRQQGEPDLPLVWQWNHNPDNNLWSVHEREGFLRLKTGRVDSTFVMARNTLTQRTIGPQSTGEVSLDVSNMKDGDYAGLGLLQKIYGLVGVKRDGKKKSIIMVSTASGKPVEIESIPLDQKTVYVKVECDFRELKDTAYFYFSLDGQNWTLIGEPLKMEYTLPHFMGYRFGLFNYATKHAGGYVDFDYFHITDSIKNSVEED
jgi:beta-xylosidase